MRSKVPKKNSKKKLVNEFYLVRLRQFDTTTNEKEIMMIEILDSKSVWVAWTNTEINGRGHVPLCVAESYETAHRIGRKRSFLTINFSVTEVMAVLAFKINDNTAKWYIPVYVELENDDDKKLRKERELREAAIVRAKLAGLSDSDIAALSNNLQQNGNNY